MILKNIIYLDSSIKVIFDIPGKDEFKTLTTGNLQYLAISYRIGLIKSSGDKITETVKINKNDIEIIDNLLNTSFRLDGLHKPFDCEITLDSMTLIIKDNLKHKININETFSFRSIASDASSFFELLNGKAKKEPSALKSKAKVKISKNLPEKKSSQNFIDSYEQFRDSLDKTDFIDILKLKTGTIDFNLKNFGISLLCKLLLLTKFVNELVDNEFQEDLHRFLKINFIQKTKSEVLA